MFSSILTRSSPFQVEQYTDISGTVTATGKKIIEASDEPRRKIGYGWDVGTIGYDEMSPELAKSLLKCTEEGFVECIAMHCFALKRSTKKLRAHPLLTPKGEEGEEEGEK